MMTSAAGSFFPAVASLISSASNPQKPISLSLFPQCINPSSAPKTNPNLTRARLELAPGTSVTSKRRCRPSVVSGSLEGVSEAYKEDEPDDSKTGATLDVRLPRRRLLVEFTCNECGERTQRLINRLAYERGLVYVQCAGCLRHHKLADNLGLVVEYDMRQSSTE